jgi:hypothetical protein
VEIKGLAPGAPTDVQLETSATTFTVHWRADAATFTGLRTDHYDVYAAQGPLELLRSVLASKRYHELDWTPVATVAAADSTAQSTTVQLHATVAYSFRVVAVNGAGASEPSGASAPAQLSGSIPGPPVLIAVEDLGALRIRLVWSEPAEDGGFELVKHVVRSVAEDETAPRDAELVYDDPDPGLTHAYALAHSGQRGAKLRSAVTEVTRADVAYRFQIAAVNQLGVGDFSSHDIAVPDDERNVGDTPPDEVHDTMTTPHPSKLRAATKASAFVAKVAATGTVPGAPTIVSVTGDTESIAPGGALVRWMPSPFTGGYSVDGFDVELCCEADARGAWESCDAIVGSSRTAGPGAAVLHEALVSQLRGGTSYHFRVRALNRAGGSEWSASSQAFQSAGSVPDAPRDLWVESPMAATVCVHFSVRDGGLEICEFDLQVQHSAITDYCNTSADVEWVPTAITQAERVEWRVGVLDVQLTAGVRSNRGVANRFRVRARNGCGWGEYTVGATTVVPKANAPLPPEGVRVNIDGAGAGVVQWVVASDEGSEVRSYEVECNSGSAWTSLGVHEQSAPMLPHHTVRQLRAGCVHAFRVRVRNEVGWSAFSDSASASWRGVPPDAPAALAVHAEAGGTVRVRVSPGVKDGGFAVTHYELEESWTAAGGSDAAHSEWRSCRLVGVAASAPAHVSAAAASACVSVRGGRTYRFRARAVNAHGAGIDWRESDLLSAHADVPTAVREMLAEPDGRSHVLVSWVWPADDGGSDIVAFELQTARPGSSDEEWIDMPCDQSRREDVRSRTEATISHLRLRLTPGAPTCFRCRAVNAVGASPFSEPTDELTLVGDVPAEPAELAVVRVGAEHLTLAWAAPECDGGLAVLEYLVEVQQSGAERGWSGMSAAERDEWLVACRVVDVAPVRFEAEIGPLRAALSYAVRVSARNANGSGAFAQLAALRTHGQRALPPSELAVREVEPGQLELCWGAPWLDGGHDVEAYSASVLRLTSEQAEAAKIGVWEELDMACVVTLPAGLHALTVEAGVHERFRFRVCALTSLGEGEFAETAEPVCPRGAAPARVCALDASAHGALMAKLVWAAPPSRGAPIIRYEIQSLATLFDDDVLPLHLSSDARFSEWADVSLVAPLGHAAAASVQCSAGSCSALAWVSADCGHTFRVRAVNELGAAEWSEPPPPIHTSPLDRLPPPAVDFAPYRLRACAALAAADHDAIARVLVTCRVIEPTAAYAPSHSFRGPDTVNSVHLLRACDEQDEPRSLELHIECTQLGMPRVEQVFAAAPIGIADTAANARTDEIVRVAFANEAGAVMLAAHPSEPNAERTVHVTWPMGLVEPPPGAAPVLCPIVLWLRFDRIGPALPFPMLLAVAQLEPVALALAKAPPAQRTRARAHTHTRVHTRTHYLVHARAHAPSHRCLSCGGVYDGIVGRAAAVDEPSPLRAATHRRAAVAASAGRSARRSDTVEGTATRRVAGTQEQPKQIHSRRSNLNTLTPKMPLPLHLNCQLLFARCTDRRVRHGYRRARLDLKDPRRPDECRGVAPRACYGTRG